MDTLPGWEYEPYADGKLACQMWREFTVGLNDYEQEAKVQLGLYNPDCDALMFIKVESESEDVSIRLGLILTASKGEPDLAETLRQIAEFLEQRGDRNNTGLGIEKAAPDETSS